MNKLMAVIARLKNPRPKKALPLSLTKRVLDGIEAQLQSKKPADAQLPLLRSHPQNGTQIPSTYQMFVQEPSRNPAISLKRAFSGFSNCRNGWVFFITVIGLYEKE
jgi:hypothetical protein